MELHIYGKQPSLYTTKNGSVSFTSYNTKCTGNSLYSSCCKKSNTEDKNIRVSLPRSREEKEKIMANKTMKTLDITINMSEVFLTEIGKANKEDILKGIHWLIRSAELDALAYKVRDIKDKVSDALVTLNGNTVNLKNILNKDEFETWENFQSAKKVISELLEETGWNESKWNKVHDIDKSFMMLFALPNIPKNFNSKDLLPNFEASKYVEPLKEYFSEKGTLKKVRSQLEYDFMLMKKGGVWFNGVKVKPTEADTKLFVTRFVGKPKRDTKTGVYDFELKFNNSKRINRETRQNVNDLFAIYLNNRLKQVEVFKQEEKADATK